MPGPVLNTTAFLDPQRINAQRINFLPIFLNNNIFLVNYAASARWASGQLIDADNTTNNTSLAWMGSANDANGFARLDNGVIMEDQRSYTVLRTHPKWVNNGTIKGWLPWVQQKGTGDFKATIGFLNGARGSDGVTFQVWIHYHVDGVEHWEPVIQQHKTYNGQLQEVAADLSKWANQEISIELRVDAGASSVQDWAGWINPRIEITPVVPQTPGPIITNDNPPFFNDRYDAHIKWYLPEFGLKEPLQSSFMFSCIQNAQLDASGKHRYNGTISFVLEKNMPSAIKALPPDATLTYTEIPISSFNISYVVQTISQPITYTGTVVQNNGEYTFTLQPDPQLDPQKQEQYLEALFNFITDRDNAKFSTISATGSYMGYVPKPSSPQLAAFQNNFRLNQVRIMPSVLHTAPIIGRPVMTAHPQVMMMHERTFAPAPAPPAQATSAPAAINVIDHPLVDYSVNSALPFLQIIANVNFPCSGADGYPNNFIKKDNNAASPVAFNCQLPFGDGSTNQHIYTEFYPAGAILTNYGVNKIYLNNRNFTYLIIPSQYLIMLEHAINGNQEDQLVPAAYLNTVIDDTNADKCTAAFKFHIAPNISKYQLACIKKLIFDNNPAGVFKAAADVVIDFPETPGSATPLTFDKVPKTVITPMGGNPYGIPNGNYFQLELQGVPIGDGSAASIAATIKGQMGSAAIVNSLVFEIDSDADVLPQSAISLSLSSITGNGLIIEKNDSDNQLYFVNQTLYDISLNALVTGIDSELMPAKSNNPLLVISNNTVANITALQPPLNITTDNYSTVIADYSYAAPKDYFNTILTEIRIDAQNNIRDSIIVTNNTGLFSLYNINRIDVIVYILAADETDVAKAVASVPISIIKDGSINNVPFTLPVGTYITSWSVVYSTNLFFTNGSTQQNNVQVIKDINSIGKVINLTVATLNLSKQ